MILYGDKFVPRNDKVVDIEDRGYQFGDGVYEVVRVYNGNLFDFTEHINRLFESAEKIHLKSPYPQEIIKQNIVKLVRKNNVINGFVYVQLTRGVADRVHQFPQESHPNLIAYTSIRERSVQLLDKGLKAHLVEDIRWLRCDIKSLNLLPNVLAKEAALKTGYGEAIFVRDGVVTEGSSCNVFLVKNKKIITHPVNNLILNGITRRNVIKFAKKLQIEVNETPFTVGELKNADEVFITSTGIEIAPVIQIDEQLIKKGNVGEVTRKLQGLFENSINKLTNARCAF